MGDEVSDAYGVRIRVRYNTNALSHTRHEAPALTCTAVMVRSSACHTL